MDPLSAFLAHLDTSYSPLLTPLTQPIFSKLHLPYAPPHIPTFLFSLIIFQVTFLLSSFLSPFLSRHYKSLSKKTRYSWDVHSVSQVNALMLVWLSLRCWGIEGLDGDRVFGWDERVGRLCAVACGYFLWDTLEVLFFGGGLAFVLHGLACLCIFSLSFQPFLAYYAPRSLIWEASTLFLNIHWWLDKTNRTGSTFQLINGFLLLVVFFLVRIVYGAYMTFNFWQSLFSVRAVLPTPILVVYLVGNATLNILNWLWLFKMLAAMQKRFFGDANSGPKAVNGSATKKVE